MSGMKHMKWWVISGMLIAVVLITIGCAGSAGPAGPAGSVGPAGPQGPPGESATTAVFGIKDGGAVCITCHVLAPHVQPPDGSYTLAYEANHGWEGHGFDSLDESKTIGDCLVCHAVGTGDRAGKGTMAPISLREIVHPVHVGSPHFAVLLEGDEEERPGNCFTCHMP